LLDGQIGGLCPFKDAFPMRTAVHTQHATTAAR
jgi:hypothetical protein